MKTKTKSRSKTSPRLRVLVFGARADEVSGPLTRPPLSEQIELLPSTSNLDEIAPLRPHVIFTSGYFKKIPESYLDLAPLGFYGFHETDLPDGKGHAPLAWTLIKGKKHMTVTQFRFTKSIDAGPVAAKLKRPIKVSDTMPVLQKARIEMISRMIRTAVEKLLRLNTDFGNTESLRMLPEKPQRGRASYYPRRSPASSLLDPSKSLARQWNLLRACDSQAYPAYFFLNGIRFVIREEPAGDHQD